MADTVTEWSRKSFRETQTLTCGGFHIFVMSYTEFFNNYLFNSIDKSKENISFPHRGRSL